MASFHDGDGLSRVERFERGKPRQIGLHRVREPVHEALTRERVEIAPGWRPERVPGRIHNPIDVGW
jgi:hypothetical protein